MTFPTTAVRAPSPTSIPLVSQPDGNRDTALFNNQHTIQQPNGKYVGEAYTDLESGQLIKHGSGKFTNINGHVLDGTYKNGKAVSGTLSWDGCKIDFSVIENGTGKLGSKVTYYPSKKRQVSEYANVVSVTGVYTGDLQNPVNMRNDFVAEILFDGTKCRYEKYGETTNSGEIVHMGKLFAVDGQKVYDGEFLNNRPIYAGIDVKPTTLTVTYTDQDGNTKNIPVREFAILHGYHHAPDWIRPSDVAPATLSLPMVKVPEDYCAIRHTTCGLAAFAKKFISAGTVFPYTGLLHGKGWYPFDEYGFRPDPDQRLCSAREYGNLTRFIQAGFDEEEIAMFRHLSQDAQRYIATANLGAIGMANEADDYSVLVAYRDIQPGEILLFNYTAGLRVERTVLFDIYGNSFAYVKNNVFHKEPTFERILPQLKPASILSKDDKDRMTYLSSAMSSVCKLILKFEKLFPERKFPNCYLCREDNVYSYTRAKQLNLLNSIKIELASVLSAGASKAEFPHLYNLFINFANAFEKLS